MMQKKMHRYPGIIRALGDWYTVMVAIGPYHHGREHLKAAEKMKHVAAYHCIRESGPSATKMYNAVASVADDARRRYDKDAVAAAGIADDGFLPMMFYDACFLVQYMLWRRNRSKKDMDRSLHSFFYSNRKDINHDVVLLENQLPWPVVEAVMRFRHLPLEDFVAYWKDYLQDRKVVDNQRQKPLLDPSFQPPHLLGLLRFYIVGRKSTSTSNGRSSSTTPKNGALRLSVSAMELIHMGVEERGTLFAELSLAQLSLNGAPASFLVNMAALELCTTPNFQEAREEDSAVCSYLSLLTMLVHRKEDVHERRRKRVLQGGAGLVNKDALSFFTSLQSLPQGRRYVSVVVEIKEYKERRRVRIKVLAFVYKNRKTMVTVFSAIGVIVGFLSKLKSLNII
ncbi:hypothetical protein BS78_05G274600 [Paspalum vaginatum]|nr:hypothetical protein BS78_05G274600 [Paspalum vaginatum]